MPLSHVSKVYSVSDAKIAVVTADPAGGSTTYGSLIDVPGIREVTISGDVNTVELRGDDTLLDRNSSLSTITGTVSHAKISLDVLDAIIGGTITDGGTTPAMTATYLLKNTDTIQYFKLEAKTPTGGADTVTGDIHFVFHKCIVTSFPDLGHAQEDFRIVSFEFAALPLTSNGNWLSIVANETAAAIA